VRAATPSHAAEMISPDQTEWKNRLRQIGARLPQSAVTVLRSKRERLRTVSGKRVLLSPDAFLQDKRLLLDMTQRRLAGVSAALLHQNKQQFIALTSKLDALSPLAVLARGYAIALRADGSVLKDAEKAVTGEHLTLRLAQGELGCVAD